MLNGISPYGSYAAYGAAYANRAALTRGPEQAQAAQRPAPQWGREELEQAKALGFTDGKRPQDLASRQEVASMILRSLQ